MWPKLAASLQECKFRPTGLFVCGLNGPKQLSVDEMDFWLSKFVLEVRKANGDAYPLNSLYQLVCGLQRHLRNHGRADVKLFENHTLHGPPVFTALWTER